MPSLPKLSPMDLLQLPAPFDDPDFLYEVKFDGFRALAYVEDGHFELVSRKGNTYKRFRDLAQGITTDLKVTNAVLDGEIVCLDDQGRSRFYDLMFNRGKPYFYAFDLLYVDGVDLRELPLVERKAKLRKLIPRKASSVLYLNHMDGNGVELFEQCCKLDLEGMGQAEAQSLRGAAETVLAVSRRTPVYTPLLVLQGSAGSDRFGRGDVRHSVGR